MKPKSHQYPRIYYSILFIILSSCNNGPETSEKSKSSGSVVADHKVSKKDSVKAKALAPPVIRNGSAYYFISLRNKDKAIRDSAKKIIKSLTPAERNIVFRLNRVDAASYTRLDTLVIPSSIDTNWMSYSIFPAELPVIKDVKKMIIFAYYPEAFGAYEHGKLIRWGPTSMGKKSTPTPTGLFFTNWKAKETISTVNDEWKLKWNFNIANYGGVGFHEYQLPGYPASHSCLRLLEADAMYFYDWASQWVVSKGQLAAKGTPVLVYGAYPFGKSKPWWSLVRDAAVLQIPVDTLDVLLRPNLDKIIAAQSTRDSVNARMPKKVADTAVAKR